MKRYIDAEKLIKAIEDKGLDCSFALKMERLDTLAIIDELQQDKETLDLCSQSWWEEQGWIMIPPNVTLEGIDTLLKQVRKKLPQYYKLRDIETGRTFMAEFSEMAGEWYEKGTGEAHSIASVEMVREQQEPTCKTCGFYDNNCPFIRGKFIPYPNKVCKDYTYSAMKEQSHFADADKMEQSEGNNHINLPERIFLWEDEMKEFLAGKRKTVQIGINQDLVRGLLTYIRYDVAQEVVQPEIDLEKEIDEYFSRWMQGASDEGCYNADSQLVSIYDCHRIARHFAEWGAIHLNARKEE